MMSEVLVGRNYRHFKGGEYTVLGLGTCSETLEPVVIYHGVHNPTGRLWVRPFVMFISNVQDGTRIVPRFSLVE